MTKRKTDREKIIKLVTQAGGSIVPYSTPHELTYAGAFTAEQLNKFIDVIQADAFEQAAAVVPSILKHAAEVVELYDDATMQNDHMIDSSDCHGILNALIDYYARFYGEAIRALKEKK